LCGGRAELGAAQWWWLRRQCSSCDDAEALNFAAADSFTRSIVNATSVAGTKALFQMRLKNQSNSDGDKMEVRLKLLGAPDVCSHLLYRYGVIDSITLALAVAGLQPFS